MQMHDGERSGEGSFNVGLQKLFYTADLANRRKLVEAFPEFFDDEVPEFGIIKRDRVDKLRSLLKAYHETEQDLITTNPTLAESDLENYSDSYKWLRFPIPDEQPETVSNMISSGVEEFPNDCLAGLLAAILKNQVSNGVSLAGLSIDRIGNSFRFCISGSTSLEDLRNLCEPYVYHRESSSEK